MFVDVAILHQYMLLQCKDKANYYQEHNTIPELNVHVENRIMNRCTLTKIILLG